MEIEKRYRTYSIALGIHLGFEKWYRTYRYNSLGRNRTLTRTPGTLNEKFPIHMILQYSKRCKQDQHRAHQCISRWNLLQVWPSFFCKIFYLRKYSTVPGLFRHPLYWNFHSKNVMYSESFFIMFYSEGFIFNFTSYQIKVSIRFRELILI